MDQLEKLLFLRENTIFWQRYLIDGLVACISALIVTFFIYELHLYPHIPNISLLYLLVVWGLAISRGLYASLVSALVAFFSFDFFVVPPLYTFTISKPEEWLALFFFLATAIITGLVASKLRQSVDDANRREQEARVLYDLVSATTNEDDLSHQLDIVVHALVGVFSSAGVRDCSIFLPDERGHIVSQASTYKTSVREVLTGDEEAMMRQVLIKGDSIDLYDAPSVSGKLLGYAPRVVIRNNGARQSFRRYVRIIPLKIGLRVIGLLHLRIEDNPSLPPLEKRLGMERVVLLHTKPSLTWILVDRFTERMMGVKRQQSGAEPSFFWTFLDQTTAIIERARLHQENLQVEVLRRTDALRASLLSSVSHDLRTPLSSIKAAASSLQQKDVEWDDEARQSFAATIEREADRLNRFVGNLLDMSRIEGGALKPEKEWYPIGELVHDVLAHMQFPLRGREVVLHIPEQLPPVELDYLQIDQVLTNIIENATRYTPVGSPLEISIVALPKNTPTEILVSVADSGMGIPQEDKERIFDKFYRVLGTPRKSTIGSGLGLAVCRGLIEAHGGHIWADNRPEGGAVFRFTLPVSSIEEAVV